MIKQRGTLRFVLGDQLSRDLSNLRDLDPTIDVVLMAEVMDECTYVRHHSKKSSSSSRRCGISQRRCVPKAFTSTTGRSTTRRTRKASAANVPTNYFGASRPLPWFWWSGETEMNCLAQCIGQTKREAYAHHTQRLMVTGNFALLAGLAPKEVCEWYLIVYADAYEWVELPNTHGMALFADGGVMASKPYAASGKYIDRMSDYYRHCRYDVRETTGPDARPFNFLYWNFLAEHREKLRSNQRLTLVLKNLDRMPAERLTAIRTQARVFLEGL